MTITMKSVIERAGGATAFARATGYPRHTVAAWLSGRRTCRNPELPGLLADALYHRRYCTEEWRQTLQEVVANLRTEK